jgi:tetratricopeptide (TPR) repeat protein
MTSHNGNSKRKTQNSKFKTKRIIPLIRDTSKVLRSAFCILSFAFPSALSAGENTDLMQQAEAAWQERDQEGRTLAAIALWEKALEKEPDSHKEVWIKLTKAMGRAVRHAADSKERMYWADRARQVGEQAVKENPREADAYAAYGEALGQWAQAHKGVRSLKAVRKAVRTLEKAVELDPHNSYAHMLLAEFYRQSPRFFSIGDKKKALQHACLAVGCGPGYAINHLVLARAYLDVGKKDQGVAELQKILNLAPPQDAIPETRADQETAREMLQALGIPPAVKSEPEPAPAVNQCGGTSGYCTEQETK